MAVITKAVLKMIKIRIITIGKKRKKYHYQALRTYRKSIEPIQEWKQRLEKYITMIILYFKLESCKENRF